MSVGRLSSPEAFTTDQDSADWITINYKRNRGVLYDGCFPHYADEIKYIRPGLNRVVLGFNCFSQELAECNLRAPEHSDVFNRTIKLYQRLAGLGMPITLSVEDDLKTPAEVHSVESTCPVAAIGKGQGVKMSAKDILKNPALAKLLVKAAKNVKAATAAAAVTTARTSSIQPTPDL
jgi:hypothetical protein